MEERMATMEVGVGAAADAAYNVKRREEMAASEAAAEIQRMKRGYLIKVCCFKEEWDIYHDLSIILLACRAFVSCAPALLPRRRYCFTGPL